MFCTTTHSAVFSPPTLEVSASELRLVLLCSYASTPRLAFSSQKILRFQLLLCLLEPQLSAPEGAALPGLGSAGITSHARHGSGVQLLLRIQVGIQVPSQDSALSCPSDRVPRAFNRWVSPAEQYRWEPGWEPALLPCCLSHPPWSPPSTTWPSSHLHSYNFPDLGPFQRKGAKKFQRIQLSAIDVPTALPTRKYARGTACAGAWTWLHKDQDRHHLTQTQDLIWTSEEGSALCSPDSWGPCTDHSSTT